MTICDDKQVSVKEFLEKHISFSAHDRNIKILATEIFELSKAISRLQMSEIFESRNEYPYNLRYNPRFSGPYIKSVYQRISHYHT